MKKIILILSIMLFMASFVFANTVEIGSGTSTDRYPLGDYFVYQQSQMLFTAAEIGLTGDITHLRWYRNDTGADPTAVDVEIWLKETTDATITTTTWETPGTLVYSGTSIDLGSGDEWYEIDITDFIYSGGSNNLLVSTYCQDAPFTSPHAYWRYSTTASTMVRRGQSDSANPPTLSTSTSRPNIQIEITPPAGTPGAPTNPSPLDDAVAVATSGNLTWTWGSDSSTYDLWFGPVGSMVEVVSGGTVSGLAGTYAYTADFGTEYEWQVIVTSSTPITTDGPVWSFTSGYPTGYSFESFEVTFPPAGWDIQSVIGNDWTQTTTTSPDGTKSARLYYVTTTGSHSRIVTPKLIITASDFMDFYCKYTTVGNLKVQYSTDATNWTELETVPMTTDFDKYTVDFSSITPGDYYLGFLGETGTTSSYVYLDAINYPPVVILPPGVASNPDPVDDGTYIPVDHDLSWTNGFATETVDVYFGISETLVTNKDASVKVVNNLDVATYDPGTMVTSTEYFWRVVSKNSGSARYDTDGPVWSFETFPEGLVQIGSGTNTNQSLPIEPYYGYDYSQTIYLSTDFGTPGADKRIEKIYYNYTKSSTGDADENNWVIYMGTTDSVEVASTTDWFPVAGLTEVFNGSVGFDALPAGSGWLEITLTTPFVYNPALDDNLIIAVDENSSGDTGSSDDFYCDQDLRANVSIEYHNDSTNPDPASPPTGNLRAYYPNTRFTFGDIPAVPVFSISPDVKDFGFLLADSSSDPQTFTISNLGGADLIINPAISITGDVSEFLLTDVNSYPLTIIGGGSATLDVTFTPTTAGSKSANLQVTHNAAGSPSTVALTGEAYPSDYVIEGFETAVPPAGWTNDSWTRTTSTVFEGLGSAYKSGSTSTQYLLYTPLLTIATGDNLIFTGRASATSAELEIVHSTDGTNWTVLETITYTTANTWEQKTVDLTTLGGSEVYFGFRTGLFSNSFYLDNVIHPVAVVIPPGIATNPNPAHEAINVLETNDLTWTNGFGAETIDLYFDTVNPPVAKVLDDVTAIETYDPTLAYSTTYYWRVDSRNPGSARYVTTGDVWEFTTRDDPVLVPDFVETFDTFIPLNWIEAGSGDPTTGPGGIGSADWVGGTFPGGDADAKINLWQNVDQEWLISPEVNLGSTNNFQIELDIAVTSYNNSDPDVMGSDDEVLLLISDDDGATSITLDTWNASDNLPNSATHVTIDLSSYSGLYRIAIWASDGSVDDTEDYDFHIDNFQVREVPSCLEPTDLTVGSETNNGATLSWISGDSFFDVFIVAAGDSIPGPTTTPTIDDHNGTSVIWTGGTQATIYDWFVRADCAAGAGTGQSSWVQGTAFATLCDVITSFPYTEGFEDAWVGDPAAPQCWAVVDNNADGDKWIQNTSTSYVHSGAGSAKLYTDYNAANDDWLITPALDLGTTTEYQLRFWTRAHSTSEVDELQVLLSTTDSDIASFTTTLMASTTIDFTTFAEYILDLSSYTNTIYIAFVRNQSPADGWNLYLDDVTVEEIPAIPIFSINPETMDFGTVYVDNSTGDQTFTISNTGVDTLRVSSVSITGTDASHFVLTDLNTYPESLSVNTIDVDVLFHPTSVGVKNAFLTVVDDLARASHNIPLTGEGTIPDPGVVCSNPITLTLPAVGITGDTSLYGDDYNSTDISPSSSYLNGDDVVYQFTTTGLNTLDGTIVTTGSYIGAFILSDCPNPTTPPTPVIQKTSSSTTLTYTAEILQAGTYYLIISSWPSPQDIDYDINLTATPVLAPTAATDPDPADDEIDVSVLPTLSWTNNGVVESTVVWFGDSASRIWEAVDTLYSGSTYSLDLLAYDTEYFWKIVNYNGTGNTEGTAVQWSFTTMSAEPVNPTPADLETVCFEYQVFSWDDIPGVDSYNIYIGTTAHGSDIVNGENVTTNSYENTVPFDRNTTYHWYVESDTTNTRTVIGISDDFEFTTTPTEYYTQGFEDTTFPPNGWTSDSWVSSYTEHTQDLAAYRSGYSAESDTLITPRLDLRGGSEEMSFYWRSTANDDTDSLLVVFNNGTTLDTLATLKGVDSDWHKATYTLTSMLDECYVEFRLFAPASDGDSYYIDDVVLPPRWYPDVSFELSPLLQTGTDDPGDDIIYDFTVHNSGIASDTYTVSGVGIASWISASSPSPFTVASDSTETLQVTVSIPIGATLDIAHIDDLIVTSQTLGTVSASAQIVTTPHTMDIYEPNNDFASAYLFTTSDRSTTWAASVTTEVYPDDDVDFFKFTGTTGQFITIDMDIVSPSTLNGGIVLYNAAHDILADVSGYASGPRILEYELPDNSEYFIELGYYSDVPSVVRESISRSSDEEAEMRKLEASVTEFTRAATGDYSLFVTIQAPAVVNVSTATISKTVDFWQTDTALLNVGNTGEADLNYSATVEHPSTVYYAQEDFDVDFGLFTDESSGEWVITTAIFHNDTQSIVDGYDSYADDIVALTSAIDLSGETNAKLGFWHIPYLEGGGYDQGYVDISTDGGTVWTELDYFDKDDCSPVPTASTALSNDAWIYSEISLAAYADDNIQIRFRLDSDSSVEYAGWAIDEVKIFSTPNWLLLTDGSGTVAGSMNADITLNFDSAGLAAGTYNANVIVASNGGADVTVPVTLTVLPIGAPTNITISAVQNGVDADVTIGWDAVDGATSYIVYRTDDPNATFPDDWTASTEIIGTSWNYTSHSTVRFYKVTAKNLVRSSDDTYVPPVRDSGKRTRN